VNVTYVGHGSLPNNAIKGKARCQGNLRGGIESLAKLHQVEASLTQGWANRWCRRRLPRRDDQLEN
jgi:hypothetical protein